MFFFNFNNTRKFVDFIWAFSILSYFSCAFTNIGIIDITDIPTLYIPLINRTEVAVTIKTIGGYNTTYTAKIITNNSPVIQLIPNLTGWIDCFVIYNIIATDSDNDSLIYTSDYPIEGNTIVFYGFSIGEFPGIVTVSVRFI